MGRTYLLFFFADSQRKECRGIGFQLLVTIACVVVPNRVSSIFYDGDVFPNSNLLQEALASNLHKESVSGR